jgi:hypothetical protein
MKNQRSFNEQQEEEGENWRIGTAIAAVQRISLSINTTESLVSKVLYFDRRGGMNAFITAGRSFACLVKQSNLVHKQTLPINLVYN